MQIQVRGTIFICQQQESSLKHFVFLLLVLLPETQLACIVCMKL